MVARSQPKRILLMSDPGKEGGRGGGVGGEHRSQGKEMLPTLVVGW